MAWYNQERLHEALGYVPPAEYEAALTGTSHPVSQPSRASHASWNKTRGTSVLLVVAVCVQVHPSRARVSAAFVPTMCPADGIQLARGGCASCPDGMVMSVWPDRSGINCDYRQARPTWPPITSTLLADVQ